MRWLLTAALLAALCWAAAWLEQILNERKDKR